MLPGRFAAWLALSMVLATALARLVPHPWNFTPLVAMALFGGARLRQPGWAVIASLSSLALGDVALGFFPYPGMAWVYGATVAVVLLGTSLRRRPGVAPTAAATVAGGAIFYLVTNFGVWASGSLYPKTLAGLAACYAAGIPFYRNQLMGDLFFAALLFGGYALALAARTRYLLRQST